MYHFIRYLFFKHSETYQDLLKLWRQRDFVYKDIQHNIYISISDSIYVYSKGSFARKTKSKKKKGRKKRKNTGSHHNIEIYY